MKNKYKVITLCGCIKFKEDFLREQSRLSLDGNIVLTPVFLEHYEGFKCMTKEIKTHLCDLHKSKIDMADEIFVINKNGYIGENTKDEIKYALNKNKKVNYMEQINN